MQVININMRHASESLSTSQSTIYITGSLYTKSITQKTVAICQ